MDENVDPTIQALAKHLLHVHQAVILSQGRICAQLDEVTA